MKFSHIMINIFYKIWDILIILIYIQNISKIVIYNFHILYSLLTSCYNNEFIQLRRTPAHLLCDLGTGVAGYRRPVKP